MSLNRSKAQESWESNEFPLGLKPGMAQRLNSPNYIKALHKAINIVYRAYDKYPSQEFDLESAAELCREDFITSYLYEDIIHHLENTYLLASLQVYCQGKEVGVEESLDIEFIRSLENLEKISRQSAKEVYEELSLKKNFMIHNEFLENIANQNNILEVRH